MERILNKVAMSVKIFSLIGAAMGVAFIILAIVRDDACCTTFG